MKKIIGLSLVLYGENYINKFFNYSFKTILCNLNQANINKNYKIKFIISTKNNEKKYIQDNILSKISADIHFIEIDKEKRNNDYNIVTSHQLKHLVISKNLNIDFLYFLYADIIFFKNSFLNSLKIIKSYKVICTFAMLLDSKNENFQKFYNALMFNGSKHLKILIDNENLVDKYHQTFSKKSLNFNKSFFYEINKNILIKTFHYHPMVISIKKSNINIDKFKNIYTLDNNFLDKLFKFDDIFIEENLKKISLFSFDEKSRIKNNLNDKNFLSKSDFNKIDNILLNMSAYAKSPLERKLFESYEFFLKKKNKQKVKKKKIFFYIKEKLLYSDIKFIFLLDKIFNAKIGKLNYFIIFFWYIILLLVELISKNKFIYNLILLLKKKIFGDYTNKLKIQKLSVNKLYAIFFVKMGILGYTKVKSKYYKVFNN